jgi:hypothetical protein
MFKNELERLRWRVFAKSGGEMALYASRATVRSNNQLPTFSQALASLI